MQKNAIEDKNYEKLEKKMFGVQLKKWPNE